MTVDGKPTTSEESTTCVAAGIGGTAGGFLVGIATVIGVLVILRKKQSRKCLLTIILLLVFASITSDLVFYTFQVAGIAEML